MEEKNHSWSVKLIFLYAVAGLILPVYSFSRSSATEITSSQVAIFCTGAFCLFAVIVSPGAFRRVLLEVSERYVRNNKELIQRIAEDEALAYLKSNGFVNQILDNIAKDSSSRENIAKLLKLLTISVTVSDKIKTHGGERQLTLDIPQHLVGFLFVLEKGVPENFAIIPCGTLVKNTNGIPLSMNLPFLKEQLNSGQLTPGVKNKVIALGYFSNFKETVLLDGNTITVQYSNSNTNPLFGVFLGISESSVIDLLNAPRA